MTEAVAIESAASPEVQAKAEAMGWIPPTRFKGDLAGFVDAEEYIERGEQVLPIVCEHNKRLKADVERVSAENLKIAAALAHAQKAIDEIEERHTVATQKAVERAKAQVVKELAAANEAGDHQGAAELTNQLVELNAVKAEPPEPKKPEAPAPYVPDPALKTWAEENPWFGQDRRKTALAMGIAAELREKGTTLVGAEFYAKVSEEMEKTLPPKERPADKVDGGRNGSGDEASRGARGKSYASLPADAKAACDSDARNFVGPGKKYKTSAEWQSRYAELYFQE